MDGQVGSGRRDSEVETGGMESEVGIGGRDGEVGTGRRDGEVGTGGMESEGRSGGRGTRAVNLSTGTYFRCASSGPLSVGVLTHHSAGGMGAGLGSLSGPGEEIKKQKRSLNHSRCEGSRRWMHLNTEVRGRPARV